MLLSGHEVIGYALEYQNGCFSREKYWFRGWIKDFPRTLGTIQFVQGWSGLETIVTVEKIKPTIVFNVS